MTWQDWATVAVLAAAAVFSGLTVYRTGRAVHHSREAERYCRQACDSLRRVEQIRARRVDGATVDGGGPRRE